MATSSDGLSMPSMPDFSAHTFSSAAEMKFHLQSLLDSKEKQIQQIGILGQRLLAQQAELDERVRHLQDIEADKSDDEDLDTDARERYRELTGVMSTWDTENAQLSSTLASKRPNGKHSSPSMPLKDLHREEPERSKASGSSAAQSRRAKNAAHRADDVEFAFEIGSGLLTEVRRLQSLLGERDKAIQDMKEEKDDLERSVESLRTAVREQEQSSDKYKEENWNLEVTLQDLRSQTSESQATIIRLDGEHKRLTKLLNGAREATDQHKNEAERLKLVHDDLKAKHETDIAQARKHAAGLQRDKSDLQSTLDSMKAEVAKSNRRLPRFGSPVTPNGQGGNDYLTPGDQFDDDIFTRTGGASTNRRKMDPSAVFPVGEFGEIGELSPDPSPSRSFLASNHPSNEIDALQQRLAHAQRQISTLKGTLNREKELRMEYKRKLDSPGAVYDEEDPQVEHWEDDVDAEEESKPRHLTPFRPRGGRTRGSRGRGRGGLTLAQRLGMAANSPSSEYNFDDFNDTTVSPPPPVPPIPSRFHDFDSDEDIEQEPEPEPRSPSPLAPPSNRTSVDGMDPMFANVLRRSASFNSIPSNSSPLRQSVIAKAARGGASLRRRGGAAYQEARPPSLLVGQPDALATELGLGDFRSSIVSDDIRIEVSKETADFACQTDFEDVALIVPPIAEHIVMLPAPPVMNEMGVQVDSEPIIVESVPVPEPVVATAEFSCQTIEPVVVYSDTAVQHNFAEPTPVLVSASMNTEPEEELPVAPVPVKVQAEVQTPSVATVNVDTQTTPIPVALPFETVHMDTQSSFMQAADTVTPAATESRVFTHPSPRRTTITQHDYSRAFFDNTSGDSTLRDPPTRQPFDEHDEYEDTDDDRATETGVETDADDYLDARQSINMTTPLSESREDFHSILTMTDDDFSESDEDDDESLKASRMPSRVGMASTASFMDDMTQSRTPTATYESKGVSAEIIIEAPKPVEVVEVMEVAKPVEARAVQVEAVVVKPEVREISVQTDEWQPPVTVQTVVPALQVSPVAPTPTLPASLIPGSPSSASVPNAFGLYRVGSTGQQFQFVTPPSPKPQVVSSPITVPVVLPAPTPISTGSLRDSTATFGPRTSQSDRKQSTESAMTSVVEEVTLPRVSSTAPSAVDRSKPPMMALPPPPRLPPPPNSMPPPSFIPERRVPTSSSASQDMPPPRPSSPPPPDLIQRATTPTFGAMLSVHARNSYGPRQHGSSMPPSQSSLRQPPSTRSFRSAANAVAYSPQAVVPSNLPSWSVREKERRELSSISLGSGGSALTPRSSMSSEHNVFVSNSRQPPSAPVTPEKTADKTIRPDASGSTDPTIIHAITQTMIGEYLYKYTRRAIGKGYGERRHKRFFWVHPYTKTLYWSSLDPGSSNVSESSAKSAYIDGVRSVLDPNPMPPGLYQYSVVVSTPQREMKITAPTKERHDIWLNALKYLLARPNTATVGTPGGELGLTMSSPMSQTVELTDDDHRQRVDSSPKSQRSGRSGHNGTWSTTTTPRGQRSHSQLSVRGSVGKRSGTPAAEYLRWAVPDSPYSPTKSFEQVQGQGHEEEDLDFELHDGSMGDEGFEGLENVRACCDGRHTVGRSGKNHHHHSGDHHLDVHPSETTRPASPAWSFRSRTGSAHSHEGGAGGGLFSWGRGEDGKLRFGSRRSQKTVSSAVSGTHDP